MNKPANYNEQVKYYTERFDEVHVVSCDKCHTPLAFEVRGGVDGAGDMSHPEGRVVVPVSFKEHPQGMALMSWRPRLDGQVGYQCGALIKNPKYDKAVAERDKIYETEVADYKERYKGTRKNTRPPEPMLGDVHENEFNYCNNTTILAKAEQYRVPVDTSGTSGQAPVMLPFEREQLKSEIALSGNKPDVEVKGNTKRVETFKIERIK